MGKTIRKYFRRFLWSGKDYKDTQGAIQELIESDAFKLLEKDFRNTLEATYYDFMITKPEDLIHRQMKINMLVQVWERIYDLAGLKWSYNRYRQIDTMPEDKEEQNLETEIDRMLQRLKEAKETEHGPIN